MPRSLLRGIWLCPGKSRLSGLFPDRSATLFQILIIEEKTTYRICGLWFYADNFFLPFNLLAAKTFLPPFVLILALNPWTFALERFFGWNVIFIGKAPPSYSNFRYSHACQNLLPAFSVISRQLRKHRFHYIRKKPQSQAESGISCKNKGRMIFDRCDHSTDRTVTASHNYPQDVGTLSNIIHILWITCG